MPEPAANRPPTDTVRVALSGTVEGTVWVNRFWLRVTRSGSPAATDLVNVLNAFAAAFRTHIVDLLSVHLVADVQRAVWFTSGTDELGVDGTDTGSGSITGDAMPANVAALLDWSISGTYRGGHPRTYLAGIPESYLAGVTGINPDPLAALQSGAEAFLAAANALSHSSIASVELGTVAFFRAHSALSPPVFKPYLAVAAKQRLATQRRRLRPR